MANVIQYTFNAHFRSFTLEGKVLIIYIRTDYDRRSLRRSYCLKLVRPRDKEGEIGRKGLEQKSRTIYTDSR